MKAFKPFPTSPKTPPSHMPPYSPYISPHKHLHSQLVLSKSLLPSRQRVTRNRVTSHTIKFDFPNLHSCSEIAKLNLLWADQHISALPSSFSKASVLHELTIIIISDRWQVNYRKTLCTLLKILPRLKTIKTLNLYFSNTLALDTQVTKALITALRRLKKLSACNIRVQWCQNLTYNMMPRLIWPLRYRCLKEMTLSFLGDILQTPRKNRSGHKILVNTLRKLKACRSLALELDLNNGLTDSELLDLGTQINNISGLQAFRLRLGTRNRLNYMNHSLVTAEKITDGGVLGFLSLLKRLKFLAELSLHLINCQKMTEEGIIHCVEQFFEPHRFRALNYKFEGFCTGKSVRLLGLTKPLSRYMDPKNVKLRVQTSPDFALSFARPMSPLRHKSMEIEGEIHLSCDIPPALHWEDYHVFAKTFSELPNLKEFNFTCRDNAYTWELIKQFSTPKLSPVHVPSLTDGLLHLLIKTDENIRASQVSSLLSLLQKITHAQGLSLQFSFCESVPEEILVHIMTLLPLFKSLKHLAVLFSECPIATGNVVSILSEALEGYKALENLNLNFETCKVVTNKAVLRLLTAIQELSILKNLHLTFQDCLQLTAEGLESLPKTIGSLAMLQGLSLMFPGIVETSNIELQKVGYSVCGLRDLTNLKLNFSNCEEISDRGLCALGESVMMVQGVRYLEIQLDNCWKLGNEGICQVGKYIKTLKELSSLKMSLKGCKNITAEGVNQLVGEVCEIEKLQFLTLDFGTGESVAGEIFHKADVFLKFERMENMSVNLKVSKEIITEKVDELRKRLGEVRQVLIFFK